MGPERTARVDALTDRLGDRAVFLMRLLPAFSFDWLSYAAGLTSMPVRTFAIATFLGTLPPVVAIVAVGDLLTTTPTWSIALFVILALLWAAPILWWLRPGKGP